jgi:hypothetical protein
MEEEERRVITIQYKNNLPLVCVGIIDAGSNKKIVVDAHLDFASSKTIIPTYICRSARQLRHWLVEIYLTTIEYALMEKRKKSEYGKNLSSYSWLLKSLRISQVDWII